MSVARGGVRYRLGLPVAPLRHRPPVQPQTFALAKIQPPLSRTNVVARTALAARLRTAALETRLTLLCAPAGFGKTVALTQLIHSVGAGVRVAWVSADEDDDLQRFLACICAALEPFDLPWRRAPEALAAAAGEGRAQRRQVVAEFVNALAGCDAGRGVLVFDDLHRIDDPAVFEWLETLLAQLPARWGVVIGSRIEPPLPLARWRASEDLAEFRQDDLRFSAEDVAALVAALPRPAGVSVDELVQRTQGWPAGLRLSLQADPAGGAPRARGGAAQRHVFDYLASEVLDEMPAALRDFLLRCAVLAELTAARCEQVSGDPRAAQWLDEIERRGLFVTVLDSAELTLRLHDLFRDFLEDRLRRERPDEWSGLLVRAAAHEPDVMRRVNLLVRAGAWAEAQTALVRAVPVLLLAGASAQVPRLIEQFPRDQQDSSPLLAYARGLCAWPRFEWVTMQRAMERAARGFAAAGQTAQAQQARTFETVGLMALGRIDEASQRLDEVRAGPLDRDTEALWELMAYWRAGARGPADAPAQHLHRMIDVLEGHGAPGVGRAGASLWQRCVPHFMFVGRAGMRAAMERYVAGALRAAGDDHAPLRAVAHALQAWLLLWQGRKAEAHRLIVAVQDDDRWLGQPRSLRIPILSFHAAWGLMHDDLAGAQAAARAMVADVDADPERRATWRGVYLYNLGRVSAALGDRAGLQEALDLLAATPATHEWPHMRSARLAVQSLAALFDGRLDEARARLEDAMRDSTDLDTLSLDATVRVTLARVHLRQRDPAAAWAVLVPVVRLARDAGEPFALRMAGQIACAEIAAGAAPPAFAAEHAWFAAQVAGATPVLVAAPAVAAAPIRPADAGAQAIARPSASPLSDREHDVLARIAAGDSNKLIARALDLSPHTVKRHVANILDKLALSSRGQAAAWHRAQGG